MGGGSHFCGATGSTPADWLKNDLTMVMVREKIDYAELFAPRWECFAYLMIIFCVYHFKDE